MGIKHEWKKKQIFAPTSKFLLFFVNKILDLTYNINKDDILIISLRYDMLIFERKGELDGTNISKYSYGWKTKEKYGKNLPWTWNDNDNSIYYIC